MEEINFIELWKEQTAKIEASLSINRRLLLENLTGKANKTLRSFIRGKAIGIVIAVFYLVLLGIPLFFALFHYSRAANYFIVSFGAILLINLKALYDYIHQLVLANSIEYNDCITDAQQKLARLQLSVMQHIRTMFLQLPFWTTFFLSSKWFPSQVSVGMLVFQTTLTLSFAVLAVYLYRQLSPKNISKKWVKSILSGAGSKKINEAMAFYKEIETFTNS